METYMFVRIAVIVLLTASLSIQVLVALQLKSLIELLRKSSLCKIRGTSVLLQTERNPQLRETENEPEGLRGEGTYGTKEDK